MNPREWQGDTFDHGVEGGEWFALFWLVIGVIFLIRWWLRNKD